MTKRKKKLKKQDKKDKIQELNGYTLGQHVYCLRYPDKVLCCGNITDLHKTETDLFFTFIDDITGQFRISLLEDIIQDTTKKQIMNTQNRIRSNARQAERLAEKKKLKRKRR